jgi:hypothetical protein
MTKHWLAYDCEIKQIPYTGGDKEEGLLYCDGWRDYANMDITVIAAYNYADDSYGIFLEDNFQEFQQLAEQSEHIFGFNSHSFDDNVCAENGIKVRTTYDFLRETYRAAGLNPSPPWDELSRLKKAGDKEAEELLAKYKGYRLQDIAMANLGVGKSGSGDNAAKLWQQGKFGQVINYCTRDVWLLKRLIDKRDCIISPVDQGVELYLREP